MRYRSCRRSFELPVFPTLCCRRQSYSLWTKCSLTVRKRTCHPMWTSMQAHFHHLAPSPCTTPALPLLRQRRCVSSSKCPEPVVPSLPSYTPATTRQSSSCYHPHARQ